MSMYPIATYTVGASPVSSIQIANIPQNFQHLRIIAFSRSNGASGTNLPFFVNADGTAGNYRCQYLGGNGGGTFTGDGGTTLNLGWAASGSDPVNAMGISVCDLLDYTSTTKSKTARTINGETQNGTTGQALMGMWTGVYLPTSTPITSIQFNNSAGQWTQYSTISVYGILNTFTTGA